MFRVVACLLLACVGTSGAHSPRPDVGAHQKSFFSVTPGVSDGNDFHYHDYVGLTTWAQSLASSCSHIMQLTSIGKSVQGRELWTMRITSDPQQQHNSKPEFLYVGNIHGDETVGREVLIHFVQSLCDGYNNPEWTDIPEISWNFVTQLVNATDIYVVFSANPDGFELRQRENANFVDLNRNFPDQFRGAAATEEVETQALKEFVSQHRFALGTNLHGGALLCNYPWDGTSHPFGFTAQTESISPDDELYKSLCLTYSTNHTTMSRDSEFQNGITNGAAWYPVFGGLQDYSYSQHGMLHVTLELSYMKSPPEHSLRSEWEYNRKALYKFVERIHSGVRGHVAPSVLQNDMTVSFEPIAPQGAIEPLPAAQRIFTKVDPITGYFARVLLSGTYNATCFSGSVAIASTLVTVPPPSLQGALSVGLADLNFQIVPEITVTLHSGEWVDNGRLVRSIQTNFLVFLLLVLFIRCSFRRRSAARAISYPTNRCAV